MWEGRSETRASINDDAEASRDETRAAKRAVQAEAETDQVQEQDTVDIIDGLKLAFEGCLKLL